MNADGVQLPILLWWPDGAFLYWWERDCSALKKWIVTACRKGPGLALGKPDPFLSGSSVSPFRRTHGKQPARSRRRLDVLWFNQLLMSNRRTITPPNRRELVPLIKANSGIVMQINVFTVPQAGHQPLINLLAEAGKFASSIPGWLSASLHRSHDGTRS
jgi:hypothetical protein